MQSQSYATHSVRVCDPPGPLFRSNPARAPPSNSPLHTPLSKNDELSLFHPAWQMFQWHRVFAYSHCSKCNVVLTNICCERNCEMVVT